MNRTSSKLRQSQNWTPIRGQNWKPIDSRTSSTPTTITPCQASSLRYKTDIEPYRGGLDVINRLQPIAFTRKHGDARDIGLAAEDVEKFEPRLTYPNEKGEVEGVKYELLTTVLVNAIKEQQRQIEELQSTVARLELISQKVLSAQDPGNR